MIRLGLNELPPYANAPGAFGGWHRTLRGGFPAYLDGLGFTVYVRPSHPVGAEKKYVGNGAWEPLPRVNVWWYPGWVQELHDCPAPTSPYGNIFPREFAAVLRAVAADMSYARGAPARGAGRGHRVGRGRCPGGDVSWKDELVERVFGPQEDELPQDDGPLLNETLPSNIARCPACGAKVRTDLPGQDRVRDHHLTVDCLIRRTARKMKERGMVRAAHWGPVLERCGLPVERAPAAKGKVTREEAPEPWKTRKKPGGYNLVEVPMDAPWALAEHVDAARVLENVELPAPARHALILRMLRDPECRAAVEAARLFGGPGALLAYGRRHSELAMDALGPEPPPPPQAGPALAHSVDVVHDGKTTHIIRHPTGLSCEDVVRVALDRSAQPEMVVISQPGGQVARVSRAILRNPEHLAEALGWGRVPGMDDDE